MPHNPLTYLLRKAFKEALKRSCPLNTQGYSSSRRKFIRNSSLIAGGMGLLPSFGNAFTGNEQPSVCIVGAGMAGLNAAYQLKKLGINAVLYEAAARTGGRMFTIKDKFGDNITTDLGGEYVDATHKDILQLAEELDVNFYDLREDQLEPQTFYFEGKLVSNDDLRNAIMPYVDRIESDVMKLPEEINYHHAAAFQQLDNLSITEYISSIGIKGWLYDFLNVVLTREYGMEASEQSALNLLIMFSEPMGENQGYELFGDDHEVLKITGGSQRLTNGLYKQVKNSVVLNHALKSISKTSNGYSLVFNAQGKFKTIESKYIVLAIPFSILRAIELKVDMPPEKRRCINELGYGNSGKFIMGVSNKPWRDQQQRGYAFTDLEVGCGWDSSLMQSDNEGSYTVFGGGKFMDETCKSTHEMLVKKLVPQLNKVFPGFAKSFNNKTTKYCWSKNPWSKAGYSAFKKGQWSTLAGWEQTPVGNIYFAGEHVSSAFQGYMNGAAQTGREAAEMVYEQVMKRKEMEVEA